MLLHLLNRKDPLLPLKVGGICLTVYCAVFFSLAVLGASFPFAITAAFLLDIVVGALLMHSIFGGE